MYPFPGVMAPIPAPGQPLVRAIWIHDHFGASSQGTTVGGKFATTANGAERLVTLVNSASGVPVIQDLVSTLLTGTGGGGTVGGVVKSAITGANNDKVSVQFNGEAFAILPDQDIVCECRVATSAIAGTTFLWGLCKTGTGLITDTTFATTQTDFIGFKVTGTSGALIAVVKGAGTEVTYSTGKSFVNLTWKRLRFDVISLPNSKYVVKFYIDGELVATHNSANGALPLSSVGLTPSWEGKAQASTAFDLYWDYETYIQAAA